MTERHKESQRQMWEEDMKCNSGRLERKGGREGVDGLSDRDRKDESEGRREGLLSR